MASDRRRAAHLTTRIVAAALAAATFALLPLSTPAGAIEVETGLAYATPTTWVDEAGRQHVVIAVGAQSAGSFALAVARDLPSGVPDEQWGDDRPEDGLRFVEIEGLLSSATDALPAASSDGVVTTTWRSTSCAPLATCNRWFIRYQGATGARLALPVQVAGAPAPMRALDDGSLLLGHGEQAVWWVGGDGTVRATLTTTADDLAGADVDDEGRLLTIAADGTLRRQAPSAAPDLELDLACTAPGTAAVGAAPDGGFAVACPSTASTPFTVDRHDADGEITWTSTGTATGLPIGTPARVTVDALDRAWVGSTASPSLLPGSPPSTVTVAAFSSTGPMAIGQARPTGGGGTADQPWYSDLGGGIVDLRTIGDGTEVAFADHQVCCRYANNTLAGVEVRGSILPARPSPPVCPRPTPRPRPLEPQQVQVLFAPCTQGTSAQQPTSYRVVAAWGSGSSEVTIPASSTPVATLIGVPFGRRVAIAVVPTNAQGPTVGPGLDTVTVLPFEDLDRFVTWSADVLASRDLTIAQREAFAFRIRTEERTAGETMTELLTGGPLVPRVEPVARLYLASFLRDPDTGGLDYWSRRRRDGVRLVTVAEQFARSSEFRRRYGALTNRAFVQQVYRNVFGREGDPSGTAYWARKLDAGTSRGTVLAQMSESSEHVMRSANVVKPMVASYLMLGRRPTAAERAAWLDDPDPYASVPVDILGSQAFLDRWFSPPPGP